MASGNKRRLWSASLLIVVAILVVWASSTGMRRGWTWRRVLAGADMVTLSPASPRFVGPPIVVAERGAIRALIDLVKFQRFQIPLACRCRGEVLLEFLSQGRSVARFGFSHGSALKWQDGPWWGDSHLTPDSAEALRGWLGRYAFRSPGYP